MAEILLFWGGIAGAITAILVLIGRVLSKLRKIIKMFNTLQEHTKDKQHM